MILTTPAKKTLRPVQEETDFSSLIPYAYLLDERTIETKSGHLLQVIKLPGIPGEMLDDTLINHEKHIRNTLLKSIADSSLSLYFHTIRRRDHQVLTGAFESGFAETLNARWQAKSAQQAAFVNDHYITVIKKPPTGTIRGLADLVTSLSGKLNRAARERYRSRVQAELNQVTQRLLTSLAHYGAVSLANEKKQANDNSFSELLGFLSYLINLEQRHIIAPQANLAASLPTKRLFFDSHTGMIAIRQLNNQARFAAILSIKHYAPTTAAGMFDPLLELSGEMIITQSFTFIDKGIARSKIKEQQRNQAQSDDGINHETLKMDVTLDELGSCNAATGEHHFTVLCHADSQEQLNALVSAVDATLNEIGIVAVREDRGIKAAFFAMFPANHAYIARRALVSSKNMAGLASFHTTQRGKATGNYWGDAVTVLETLSGSPYYFNFHLQDVANTFLIGPQGSGKTLLEAFLLAQSMKLGGRLIVFDKDQGLEVFVRAMGGAYALMTPGQRTGFAPFQMDDTVENRHFLTQLLRKIATLNNRSLDDDELALLQTAVDVAYQLPKHERILRNIVPYLGARKSGSLRSRFDQWVEDGDYGWVFDNAVDHLSLNVPVIGFDMTAILEDEWVLSPIYFYLFHRIEQLLDGTRTRIVVAEGWRPLQDETFRAQIKDWSSTPRKKEAFLVMDTQSPKDIAQSEVGCKVIQESVTQIYFSNPQAEYDDYVTRFKLTEKEFAIVRSLEKASHFFLLKQGKHSVVARANLTGFPEIAVLSGRKKYQPLLRAAMEQRGDEPQAWLPHYYAAVAALEVKHD